MKKIIFIFSLVSFIALQVKCQTEETKDLAANETQNPDLKVEANTEINFLELYDIDKSAVKKAKVLFDVELLSEPSTESVSAGINIPKGVIIDTYKYFPKAACWAVHYNNMWGFVPTTAVMPVKVKLANEDFTPYDEPPVLLSKLKLQYPKQAKEDRIEGKVFIKMYISKTGTVKSVEVIKGIPELNQAAIDAVKQAKFKPARYHGKPVDAIVRMPISFKLAG